MNDERVVCAVCGTDINAPDAMYDERREEFLCDRSCFEDNIAKNLEDISEWYFRMNGY